MNSATPLKDNCGLHNDMAIYTQLMNATGKTFMVERSDQGHGARFANPPRSLADAQKCLPAWSN
jgi:hypothetical protein